MTAKTLDEALRLVLDEYEEARVVHRPMKSQHEGYAVILEELEEAWTEIKLDKYEAARREMIQVAAMAIAFIVET